MKMSSRHHKKKNQTAQANSMPSLNEQAAAAESTAAEDKDQTAEQQSPAEAAAPAEQKEKPGMPETDQKSGAKVVIPARIKVTTDRDGNLIESGTDTGAKKKGSMRRSDPVKTVTPADIKKPQVSFMNSIANVEAETMAQRGANSTAQAYDHAVLVSDAEESRTYRPKIRRMSDSTRAKEMRNRQSSDSQPYEKGHPDFHAADAPGFQAEKAKGAGSFAGGSGADSGKPQAAPARKAEACTLYEAGRAHQNQSLCRQQSCP